LNLLINSLNLPELLTLFKTSSSKSNSASHSFLPSLYSVNKADNSGNSQWTHLLGVTPLVTLVNLLGHKSGKSLNYIVLTKPEWIFATPLTW